MKILIIEDEPATALRLKKMLNEIADDFTVVEIIDSVEDSISFLNNNPKPDLIFMDIHLADGNSFEIFESTKVTSPVIFTTAYDQYAIKAFKVNSIDYLLKPIKRDELISSLNKFRQITEQKIPDYLELVNLLSQNKAESINRFMVKTGQVIKTIEISDIAYFFIENKSVYAMSNSGSRHLMDFTMDQLEKQLPTSAFFRINRSMIIAYRSINSMLAYSKSRIKIDLTPPFTNEVITSTDRSGQFKRWLSGKN